ncbi:MAG: hypothetical protein V4615_03795, partial [Bacteroidota bacterium]
GYYRGDYELRNAEGKVLITYEKPVYIDAKSWGMHGMYKLMKDARLNDEVGQGNEYRLQMFVSIDWLIKTDNTYPLIIDPVVSGVTKIGDFRLSGLSANMGFTTKPQSCNYSMAVNVPGMSTLTNAYVDLEYVLTFDNMCGNPPLPSPFCQISQVTQTVICNPCNTSVNLQCVQNPLDPTYYQTCTTDPNLIPGASRIQINSFAPNYMTCIAPQCPDYSIGFTLQNRDSICGDVCGYLCARGNMWQMTIEACRVEGNITQDRTQVCAGQPVVFTAHPNCGVPPYHYVWTTDGGNTFDTIYGTPNLTVYPQQDIFVSCIIYDTCGEYWQANDLSATVLQTPPADAGADIHLCAGGTATIGGSPTTSPGTVILWSGENSTVQNYLNANIPNPSISVPNGTLDTFFYVIRASNSACARTDTVYVFSSPAPAADAGADVTICSGGTVSLGGSPTSNAASIQWTGENTQMQSWLSNSTASNPQALVPLGTVDTFNYVVTATTATCFKTDTVTIFSRSSPLADAGSNHDLCEGGTVTLGGNPTSTGGTSVLWTGSDAMVESWLSSTAAANPQVIVPQGVTGSFFYVVEVSDPLCPRSDTINVVSHVNPVAVIDTNGSTRICANQSVLISIVGNY